MKMEAVADKSEKIHWDAVLNRGWVRPHIFIDVMPGRLQMIVDDYESEKGQEWNPEAWEARKGNIVARIDQRNARKTWRYCYRLARALVKNGWAVVEKGNGDLCEMRLPVNVIVSFY